MSAPTRSRRTRGARQPDPVRLPLPGQDPEREAQLFAQLSEQFNPVGPVEEMWVEDIAWCSANIQYTRALIAAHKKRCIENAAYRRQTAPPDFTLEGQGDIPGLSSTVEQPHLLEVMQVLGYSPPSGASYLGNATFATLLGDLGEREQQQMRELQTMLHEEVRERDRVIHQITRTRQQDMAEAVAVLEAQGWVHPDRALAIQPPEAEVSGEDEGVIAADAGG